MNLFGWQPDFVVDAVRTQIDAGYEIGPQHPLAGDGRQQICELTGFDRAALCNTGSEAVMGAIRIARTVTGRNTLVIFTGSYHGIFDEVIVRGTQDAAFDAGRARHPAQHRRERAGARLRHAGVAGDHPRTRADRSPPCWSSRCRADARTSSRASSCRSCAQSPRCRRAADLRRSGDRLPLAPARCAGSASASTPTWRPTARSSAAASRSA